MSNLRTIVKAALLTLFSPLSGAVTPKDLAHWAASPTGLGLPKESAMKWGSEHAYAFTGCGVTVQTLQDLQNVLASQSGIGMSTADIQENIVRLAVQHVRPEKLTTFYDDLTSGYTAWGGLGFQKAAAWPLMLKLIDESGDPDELKALYRVMYGYGGLGFGQKLAQQVAIALTSVGADAATFEKAYKVALTHGASQESATKVAGEAAVNADLQGLVRRYAKDGMPYTSPEFAVYYPGKWWKEWLAAPLEKRVSNRRAYTADQFSRHDSSSWAATYRTSPVATQMRLAKNDQAYSMKEFKEYYMDDWQNVWGQAPELPCAQCGPYSSDDAASTEVVV